MPQRGLFVCLILFLLLCSACKRQETGPVRIAFDRDACSRCRMMISDRRFASQIRTAGGTSYLFDDFGCAVNFADEKGILDLPETQIWVAEYHENEGIEQQSVWLPAREAFYTDGVSSPMNFNLSAHKKGVKNSFDFSTAVERIRK
ncbi:MAG: hypothetical protein KDD55_12820, partial [Bdellovibrionales bacterium]|nr:hypothetical protein [Bdellovibrionales bacterium]